MSVQQEQLIVELGNSLQWLPTSARVIAWCRLIAFMENLPPAELADPILSLLPYIGDVATRDFAEYHGRLGAVMRKVPESDRTRVLVGLREVAGKLPASMRPLLSGMSVPVRAPAADGSPAGPPQGLAQGSAARRPGAPGAAAAPKGPPRGIVQRFPGRR